MLKQLEGEPDLNEELMDYMRKLVYRLKMQLLDVGISMESVFKSKALRASSKEPMKANGHPYQKDYLSDLEEDYDIDAELQGKKNISLDISKSDFSMDALNQLGPAGEAAPEQSASAVAREIKLEPRVLDDE